MICGHPVAGAAWRMWPLELRRKFSKLSSQARTTSGAIFPDHARARSPAAKPSAKPLGTDWNKPASDDLPHTEPSEKLQ